MDPLGMKEVRRSIKVRRQCTIRARVVPMYKLHLEPPLQCERMGPRHCWRYYFPASVRRHAIVKQITPVPFIEAKKKTD